MKNSTISNLFDVLSRKIISCFLTKSTASKLGFSKFEDRIIVNSQTEIGKIKNVLLHFSIIFIMCMTGIFSWSQNIATRETSSLKSAFASTDAVSHINKVYLPWETQYWQQNAIKLDYQNYTTQDGIIYKENGYSLTPSLLPLVGAATPCEAHRWLAGDGWRKNNSTNNLWEAVVQNAPNLQPKGIVRCASSAETESGLQVFKGAYDISSNPIAAILPKTDCYSMTSGTFNNPLSAPTQGEDIVWFNFDIRPLAGTYQFQIVTNESVGFVLFHVDPADAEPINGETTGTKYPVPDNGLSGNCANLKFANIDVTGVAHPACGFSGNGWTTITVPSFKKPTNYYLAMWMAKPNETTFPGSMNLVYKSRYGCGGATCTLEFDKKNTLCNTDGTYTVCMDYGGSAGRWNLVDNGAIKASLYTIKTFKEDGVTQVGSTQTSTNLASSSLSLTLGTIPDGAVLATICATYALGVTYNISLIPDPTYKPTNDYVQCGDTDTQTGSISAVIAEAGNPFTKTCISNTSGLAIGEASVTGYTYSWSPASGLTATNVSNPTANPSSTTTYTVTKTNTVTGCSDTDTVEISVNNTAVTAEAGDPFTKTCVSNTSGGTIGENAVVGFSYSWSPAAGLSAINVSNPTANPSSTTTYTVTKTNTASGCSDTDTVEISVNNTGVTAVAGNPFTKTCVSNTSGKTIGENTVAGFSYSWSPAAGLSATNVSNPTANPSSTTTYTVTKTNTSSGCSDTDTVLVTVTTDTPNDPTFCVVLPSLCDATKKGSLTILTPIGAVGVYEYSIDNGTTWQADTTFNGLNPGSITGVKVKNLANGCISNPVNCSDSNICTPSSPKTAETVVPIKTSITNKTDNVGFDAYPVPFKDQLNIKYKFDYKTDVKIEIFDLRGVLILSKTDTDSYYDKEIMLDLNFNVNKEQIYLVKVTTNRGSSVKKVISSN